MATPLSIGELTAIGIGLGNIAAWSKLIYDARKNSTNGTGRNNKICLAHTDIVSKLATVEANKIELDKNLMSLHAENREDHQQIFAELKSLSVSIAAAANIAIRKGKPV